MVTLQIGLKGSTNIRSPTHKEKLCRDDGRANGKEKAVMLVDKTFKPETDIGGRIY